MQTTGDQINRKVNVPEVGTHFVNFYFQNLKQNINTLYQSNIIKNHTRIKYQNKEYKGNELRQLLEQMGAQLSFFLEETIVMDSGARRADILVNGYIVPNNNTSQKIRFAQYITIANNHDNWFIHNSLLSILQ